METLGHFVGGRAVAPQSDRFGNVYDPATGHATKRVGLASRAEVDAAVAAAAAAFEQWAATPAPRRATALFRFRDLLVLNADRLARLITSEHGKTLADARGEVQRGLEVVEFACGVPQLLKGEYSENVGTGIDAVDWARPTLR